MEQLWIPHFKKMAVRDLPPGHDPSDPPLAAGELDKARQFSYQLEAWHGPPDIIFHSDKLRCVQTATSAFVRFGNKVPVISLDTLAQPENGDLDSKNPDADENGLVYYGPRSFSQE